MKQIPETHQFDLVIAGGGAAGLAAAVEIGILSKSSCGDLAPKVALIEKKEVPGKKLSATGNGRCNLSNAACSDREEVDSFFHCLGLLTRTDEAGRMYPYSEEAGEVSALLADSAKHLGVDFFLDTQITKVEPLSGGGFLIDGESKEKKFQFSCKKLLIAMGGKSYSAFGTTGDGYGIARRLGHSVTRLAPSLVPVCVDADLGGLAGVRTKAKVSLYHKGIFVAEETGEIQFNKDCISGICIMNLSRLLVLDGTKPFNEAFAEYELRMDLVPEYSCEQLVLLLSSKPQQQMLQTLVRKKLAAELLRRAAMPALATNAVASTSASAPSEVQSPVKAVAPVDVKRVAELLKDFRFTVSGTKGWNDAQVTRGGVVMDEIDEKTMESKILRGLYFAGEVLNYDGPCGGWNLHFAWQTGLKAAHGMVER